MPPAGSAHRTVYTDISPAEAKLVWDTMTRPTGAKVAARFRQIGRPISGNMILRWKKIGWVEPQPSNKGRVTGETALQGAAEALDAAVPVLTGNPATGLQDIAPYQPEFPNPNNMRPPRALAKTENISAICAMIDGMTDVELLRTINRRAQGFVVVIMEEASSQRQSLVASAADQLGRLIDSCARMLEVANDGAARVLDIEERKMKTISNLSQVDADVLNAIAVPNREDRPIVDVTPVPPSAAPPQPRGFVPSL